MLLVKTKLHISDIHGVGLFAGEFIGKGTKIWRFKDGFDLKFTKEEVENLPEPARNQIYKYAYLNSASEYILCSDDARFFNHSDKPNIVEEISSDDSEGINVAAKDINAGEELTCDYWKFDKEARFKLATPLNQE